MCVRERERQRDRERQRETETQRETDRQSAASNTKRGSRKRPSPPSSSKDHRQQTRTGTVSKATLWELLRDMEERVWAFLRVYVLS